LCCGGGWGWCAGLCGWLGCAGMKAGRYTWICWLENKGVLACAGREGGVLAGKQSKHLSRWWTMSAFEQASQKTGRN
jgi:hypothetical protein